MFPAARISHLDQIDDRDGNRVRHDEKNLTKLVLRLAERNIIGTENSKEQSFLTLLYASNTGPSSFDLPPQWQNHAPILMIRGIC